jgi:aminopeptidase
MTAEERLDKYARLAVEVGANLGEGQVLWVNGLIEHAPLIRAIARVAYERGARYVDVEYTDPHARHARIKHAPEDTLDWSTPWSLARMDYLAENHAAVIQVSGDPEPELFADLDGTRIGKARAKELSERYFAALNDRVLNWSIVAYPNEGWARTVFGEPDVERLWDAVAAATRLDEPDPVAAWREHIARLSERAALLNERRFDAIRFRGDGTDLTVGLTARSRWCSAGDDTIDGRTYVANMPTEEIFTTPDRRRTEGTVRSTMPLALAGTVVRDLVLRFEDGRAVQVEASTGADPCGSSCAPTTAHPCSARSRSSTASRASAAPASSSSTRSSTRTPRATSPTAPRSWRRSRAARARTRRSSKRSGSTTPRSTPTS